MKIKTILTFVILSSISLHLFSQKGTNNIQRNQNVLLNSQVSNRIIQSHIKRVSLEGIIDAHSSIFSGISALGTLIAILVAIVGIALPLFNYFSIYRPTKKRLDLIDDIEKKINSTIQENFSSYIAEHKKVEFDAIIAKLENPDNLSRVVNYLFVTDTYNWSDQNCNIVTNFLLNNNDVDSTTREMLITSIQHINHHTIISYFKEILFDDDDRDYHFAFEYFISLGIWNHLPFLRKFIIKSENPVKNITSILKIAEDNYINPTYKTTTIKRKEFGEKTVLSLLNDSEVLSSIAEPEAFVSMYFTVDKLKRIPIYISTDLYKSYNPTQKEL